MKFKTFRLLGVGAGLLLLVGTCTLYSKWGSDQDELVYTHSTSRNGGANRVAASPTAAPTTPSRRASSEGAGGLRELDEAILARLSQGISGRKVKDAFSGRSWKVNLYQDSGQSGVNRLKIDLDRDDRWDEKWTITSPSEIKRQVSSGDDGATYDREFMLAGDRWQLEGEQEPPLAEASHPVESSLPVEQPSPAAGSDGAGGPLRSMDERILARVRQGISGSKVKDAFSGEGWKVNLYRDAGQTAVNRLKIDIDRDGSWDESWTLEPEGGDFKVKRKVSPRDDGDYSQEFRLQAGSWGVKN